MNSFCKLTKLQVLLINIIVCFPNIYFMDKLNTAKPKSHFWGLSILLISTISTSPVDATRQMRPSNTAHFRFSWCFLLPDKSQHVLSATVL